MCSRFVLLKDLIIMNDYSRNKINKSGNGFHNFIKEPIWKHIIPICQPILHRGEHAVIIKMAAIADLIVPVILKTAINNFPNVVRQIEADLLIHDHVKSI